MKSVRSQVRQEFEQQMWDGNGYVHPYHEYQDIQDRDLATPKRVLTPQEAWEEFERNKALWRKQVLASGFEPLF